MSFRTLQNKFKQPLYKDDLLNVLKNGLLTAVLYGILMGALQYLFGVLSGFYFSIFIYGIAFFIVKKVKNSYYNYHILYPLLGVIFFLIGYIFYGATQYIFVIRELGFSFQALIMQVFQIIRLFDLTIYISFDMDAFNYLLDLLIFIFCVVYTYRNSKNNYY